ncbi:hypothetical protein [uncultured Maribacter sp.]|uniref:hypothetical protein n=1 Tax=uncultured Maribacter sp. TaxID=431308 RepID=UPI002623300A|nr:hypothetical protein [uncultured Maribacter sp.]
MKIITCIFTFFITVSIFGQEINYSKEVISLNNSNKYLLLIRNENQVIIYNGVFDLSQSLPIGAHYYFGNNGQIERLMEYSFSNESFEGVPIVVQKSSFFNENQELEKVITAERCTECEFSPIGIWEFYKNGKIIEKLDTKKVLNIKHEEYEIYWSLLENCK